MAFGLVAFIIKMIPEIIKKVKRDIKGRFANGGNVAAHLLELVRKAGDGNYLEIGVLHGGSLCAVALYKKELGHKGICIGVDPFDGYYGGASNAGTLKDKKSDVEVTIQTAQENIKTFKLKNTKLIKAKSPDFDIFDLSFAVCYIDGNHGFDAVLADWHKVKDITSHFVIFHDYAVIPDVKRACDHILATTSQWTQYYKGNYIFILERVAK